MSSLVNGSTTPESLTRESATAMYATTRTALPKPLAGSPSRAARPNCANAVSNCARLPGRLYNKKSGVFVIS